MGSRPAGATRAFVFVVGLVVGACTAPGSASPSPPAKVVLLTHDSFAISDGILEAFQTAHGVSLEVVRGGDAGETVNKAILTRDAPLADALFGVDNTFLSRALDAGIFDPYVSSAAASVRPELAEGTSGTVTPVDYGDVCVNYDNEAFGADLPPPQSLEQLADPRYRGMLVVENPATSSPGLAFLLATIGRFGEGGDYSWQEYWRDLRENDVRIDNDWDTAYYTSFSGGAGEGDRPLVVSYATSPAAEVVFAEPQPTTAPTAVLVDGCFRQVEYAGVLRGSKAPSAARALVDFMLSPEFQADIPLNMFVFPANADAEVPDVFVQHAARVSQPVTKDAVTIAANRDAWVEEWTDVVLR
ncbi:MAG TPA: thiamine ABC transporter substrate-binding protein [Vicinamibacterales bacterium]|nr:thiamine ABC transporter substrate-binding protein [Vicinamibacterales bacterium]